MLKSRKGYEIVKLIPKNRVLTETDGPFTQNSNSPLRPIDVITAETILGQIWETDLPTTNHNIITNLQDLLGRI